MELVNLIKTLTADNSSLLMTLSLMVIAISSIKANSIPTVRNIKKRKDRDYTASLGWSFDKHEEDNDLVCEFKESSPTRDYARRVSFNPKWKGYISEWEYDSNKRDYVKVYDLKTKTFTDRTEYWSDRKSKFLICYEDQKGFKRDLEWTANNKQEITEKFISQFGKETKIFSIKNCK